MSNSVAPDVLQLACLAVCFLLLLLTSLAHAMTFSSVAFFFDSDFWLCGRARPLHRDALGCGLSEKKSRVAEMLRPVDLSILFLARL